jgi:hypothetical protein
MGSACRMNGADEKLILILVRKAWENKQLEYLVADERGIPNKLKK